MELLVTYEESRLVVNELRLLMDTFARDEFAGTWRGLFARVKKHIKCGVLKSVIGIQVTFINCVSKKKKVIMSPVSETLGF